MVLTKTYPEHELSKVPVKAATLVEMQKQRREQTRNEVALQNERVEKRTKSISVSIPTYIKSEFAVDNPTLTSIKQRQALEKVNARKSVNLTEVIHDPKDEVKAPSLDFVRQPKIYNNSTLRESRKN